MMTVQAPVFGAPWISRLVHVNGKAVGTCVNCTWDYSTPRRFWEFTSSDGAFKCSAVLKQEMLDQIQAYIESLV